MSPEPESAPEQLSGQIVRGVGWMLAAQGATLAFGFVTSIVVARLLSPRNVGLATEAIVFVALALVLVDFGLGAAIVQRPSLSEDDKSTIFWAGMALGVGLTLAGIGLSWPIIASRSRPACPQQTRRRAGLPPPGRPHRPLRRPA